MDRTGGAAGVLTAAPEGAIHRADGHLPRRPGTVARVYYERLEPEVNVFLLENSCQRAKLSEMEWRMTELEEATAQEAG